MSNISILESYGKVIMVYEQSREKFKCICNNTICNRHGFGKTKEGAAASVLNTIRYLMRRAVRALEIIHEKN